MGCLSISGTWAPDRYHDIFGLCRCHRGVVSGVCRSFPGLRCSTYVLASVSLSVGVLALVSRPVRWPSPLVDYDHQLAAQFRR